MAGVVLRKTQQALFILPILNLLGYFYAQTYQKLTAGSPELGQMLSDIWAKIILTPWQIFFVSLVVLLAIFAFNMLGEGLRQKMDITRA